MRKIPTLFVRDPATGLRYVTREVHPACQWVLDGEGDATRKYDGTCVMYDGRQWWARREVKPGKAAPVNFVQVEHDDATGKTVGWEPIEQSAFAKYHAEAISHPDLIASTRETASGFPLGTYELVGPKVNGNPEGMSVHLLLLHRWADELDDVPTDYDGLAALMSHFPHEGIVWHHKDGRMAKIKRKDFPS